MAKTPEEWLVEIDNALEFRKEFGREEKWDSLECSYLHDPSGDTAVGPNLIYSNGDALMSSLTVPDPEILVSPETRRGADTALIVERLDAQLVRKTDLKDACDRGLLNAYLYGKLVLKIGYDSLYGYNPYYDIGTDKQFLGITLTQFGKNGQRLEFGKQKPGWPWIEPVLPHDFVVPWGTTRIQRAPWCAHRFIRPVSQMKKDPKYKNTSKLEGDMTMEAFMKSYKNVGAKQTKYNSQATLASNSEPVFKEFWEIRDAENNKILVVTRDNDKFLRDDTDAIQLAIGGLPFVCGDFVTHPRSFWTTPLAYYLGQIQHTQFDISMQQEKTRRISVLKFLVRKGVMSQEQLEKIMSGDVGAYEEIEASSGLSMQDVFGTIPQGNMIDFQVETNLNLQHARDMIGFSRNQTGEYDTSSRRTAREATFVQMGSERRTNKRTQMISQVYIDAIHMCNNLVFKFWQTPRDIMLENGWQMITGPMLDSEYSYDLSLSTKRMLSKAERKVEAFQMMIQFAQIPGMPLDKLFQYFMAAANDPAFEKLLPTGGQPGRSPSGGMPTIPGSA